MLEMYPDPRRTFTALELTDEDRDVLIERAKKKYGDLFKVKNPKTRKDKSKAELTKVSMEDLRMFLSSFKKCS